MISYDELDIPYLPSGRLWGKIAWPGSMSPLGSSVIDQGGNPAYGIFDNFHSFHATSLEGPYRITLTGSTAAQVACTATEKGLIRLTPGATANNEAALQHGRGLGAPFQFANQDLIFEARISVSSAVGTPISWALGLGATGSGAAAGLLADSTAVLANTDFVGFHKLLASTTGVSATYRASGQTAQNGTNVTKLNNVATVAASTFVKLGMRYRAIPQTVEWWVNGRLAGTSSSPARLTASEIRAATFPSTAFLTPILVAKNTSTTTFQFNIDWLACAQLL